MSAEEAAAALFRLEEVRVEGSAETILEDVSLSIPAGRITAVVGPSGAGKTTLLRLLDRLQDPDAGRITFRDRRIESYPVRSLRRRVAFVFQEPVLFPGTVRENLREAVEIAAPAGPGFEEAGGGALRRAELQPTLLDRDGRELSTGQQQRVTLARALLTEPEALLLDEPTAALDPPTSARLLVTLRRLVEERGLTAVMATHRITEARRASDRTVMMIGGKIVEEGPTDRVLHKPRHPETERFLESVDG